MTKLHSILTLLLAVSACGKAPVSSSPELLPYIEEFETLARDSGLEIHGAPMVLVDKFERKMPKNVLALCIKGGDNVNHIQVLKSTFIHYNRDSLLAITLHEQGHCALGLKHVKDPDSLMHAQVPFGDVLNRAVELFDTVKK